MTQPQTQQEAPPQAAPSVEDATAQLLIAIAFALPIGADKAMQEVGVRLKAYMAAIVARERERALADIHETCRNCGCHLNDD